MQLTKEDVVEQLEEVEGTLHECIERLMQLYAEIGDQEPEFQSLLINPLKALTNSSRYPEALRALAAESSEDELMTIPSLRLFIEDVLNDRTRIKFKHACNGCMRRYDLLEDAAKCLRTHG